MQYYWSKYNILIPLHGTDEWESVLINGLSGHVAFLNGDYMESVRAFRNGTRGALDREKLHGFMKGGFVFKQEDDERAAERAFERAARDNLQSRVPPQFVIRTTDGCNYGCASCAFAEGRPYIERKVASDAVRFVRTTIGERYGDNFSPSVTLAGGEPLAGGDAERETFRFMLNELHELGSKVLVITNGRNLERYVTHLEDVPDVSLELRVFSKLDMLSPESPTIRGIEKYRRSHRNVTIKLYLRPEELGDLPALIDAAYDRGWGYSSNMFFVVYPFGDAPCPVLYPCRQSTDMQFLKDLLTALRDHPLGNRFSVGGRSPLGGFGRFLYLGGRIPRSVSICAAVMNSYFLDPDGSIYTCWESAGHASLAVGSFSPDIRIDEEPLARWRNRTVTDIPACADCPFRFICCGGCALEGYRRNASFTDPVCEPVSEMLQTGFDVYSGVFQNRLLQKRES